MVWELTWSKRYRVSVNHSSHLLKLYCNNPGFVMACWKTQHLEQATTREIGKVSRRGPGALWPTLCFHLFINSRDISFHFFYYRSLWNQIQVFSSIIHAAGTNNMQTQYWLFRSRQIQSGFSLFILYVTVFFPQLQFLLLLSTYLSALSLLTSSSISHYLLLLLADASPVSKLSSSGEDNCFKEIQFTVSSTSKEDLKPGEETDLGEANQRPR